MKKVYIFIYLLIIYKHKYKKFIFLNLDNMYNDIKSIKSIYLFNFTFISLSLKS